LFLPVVLVCCFGLLFWSVVLPVACFDGVAGILAPKRARSPNQPLPFMLQGLLYGIPLRQRTCFEHRTGPFATSPVYRPAQLTAPAKPQGCKHG
jgi:hypothetical protein